MNDMTLWEAKTRLSRREDGPDFLCIGQQKAGTGWLYDMLQFEPDFWMPPIKELHYFNKKFPAKRIKERYYDKMMGEFEKWNERRRRNYKRPLDGRDAAFFEHAITYKGKKASIDWYKKLFAPKEDLVSGDITPAYSTLGKDAIASIAEALPDLRVFLLLRDPVSRFWSHFNMRQRRVVTGHPHSFKEPSADFVSAFQQTTSAEEIARFMRSNRVRRRSYPTVIYGKWSRRFDPSQISVVFFEDIVESPETVIKRFREDLGLAGNVAGNVRAPADFNRKATQLKREMTDEVRAVLVDTFRDEMLHCAEKFGGPAENWPQRYGIG